VPARQLVDRVGELSFGVDAVQFRGLDQGVKDRGTVVARVGPRNKGFLRVTDDHAAQQEFGNVIVDGELAILGVTGQRSELVPSAGQFGGLVKIGSGSSSRRQVRRCGRPVL
jgi:hypothetical protein